MLLIAARRRAWWFASVSVVSLAAFLGLAMSHGGAASANPGDAPAATADVVLSTPPQDVAPTVVVHTAAACTTDRLTPLAPDAC